MVGPFEPDLVLGVATYALELFTPCPTSTSCTCRSAWARASAALMGVRDLLGLHTEIVGVVAEGAPANLLSFEAGQAVATETADTFVDGVATAGPRSRAVELICAGRRPHRRRARRRRARGDAGPAPLHPLAPPSRRGHRPRRCPCGARPAHRPGGGRSPSGANADASLVAGVLAG